MGASIKMLNQNQSISTGANETGNKEESVDELLAKLASKGKKVKLVDEDVRRKSMKDEFSRADDSDDDDRANQLASAKKELEAREAENLQAMQQEHQ